MPCWYGYKTQQRTMTMLTSSPSHHHPSQTDLPSVQSFTTSDLIWFPMVCSNWSISWLISESLTIMLIVSAQPWTFHTTETLSPSDAKKNLELAFRVAENELGCTQYLEAGDLTNRWVSHLMWTIWILKQFTSRTKVYSITIERIQKGVGRCQCSTC